MIVTPYCSCSTTSRVLFLFNLKEIRRRQQEEAALKRQQQVYEKKLKSLMKFNLVNVENLVFPVRGVVLAFVSV